MPRWPQGTTTPVHQFKKPRLPDEQESGLLYSEHMVEVGQYLRRKLTERKEKNGRPGGTVTVTNSKFWYEVRKKIQEVGETEKSPGGKNETENENEDDSDDINNDSAVHTTSADSEVCSQCTVFTVVINRIK